MLNIIHINVQLIILIDIEYYVYKCPALRDAEVAKVYILFDSIWYNFCLLLRYFYCYYYQLLEFY